MAERVTYTNAQGTFVFDPELWCDCCNSVVPVIALQRGAPDDPHKNLCEFCYTTLAGSHTRYPHRGDMYAALRAEIWVSAAVTYNALKFGCGGAS